MCFKIYNLIINCFTVKRDSVGDWYVIFSCDLGDDYKPQKLIPMTGKSAGFDFGLSCFLTSSENKQIESPEFLKSSLKELQVKSKKLSSKQKGSRNRAKARQVVARVHRKIVNQRQDFYFNLANDLVKKYDHLFFEDLNLDAMKRLWGRKVSDLGLYQLLQRIEFKAKEYGKIMHKIDRFYPSSKTCSKCLDIKDVLTLKDRVFKCQNCGYEINRDLNAAINILTVGISTAGLDGISQELALASVV